MRSEDGRAPASGEWLAVLRESGLMDARGEASFDRLSRLACRLLDVPAAAISLAGRDGQFIKSCEDAIGPSSWPSAAPLATSLCTDVVASRAAVVIEDVETEDRRGCGETLRALGVAACVGVPLWSSDGRLLGSFCALDRESRRWRAEEVELLTELAGCVETEVRLRLEAGQRLRGERKVRALVDHSPDLVVRFDRGLRHVFVNAVAERVTGVPAARMLGRSNRELGMPAPLCAVWEHAIGRAFESGEPQQAEFDFSGPEGRRHYQTRLVPEYDARGEVETVLGVTRDITDLRAAEAALRESEAYFRALTENADEVLSVLNPDGTTRFHSGSMARVLGYPLEERAGRSFLEVVHPADRDVAWEQFSRLLTRPEETVYTELRMLHRDGSERILEIMARNLTDEPSVRGVVVNARDITRRRQMEEQLRQSQKMEAVGRLAGGVAHDFNNLLTVIKGNVTLLRMEQPGDAPGQETLDEIRIAAERAAELTNQLLVFSRKQVLQPREVDLNESVRGTQRMLARLIGEDIELVTDLQAGLWKTRADPGQMEQLVLNLAVNARDAMPSGGVLRVETRNIRVGPAGGAGNVLLPPGDYVRLEVGDTGFGMTPEVQARIFEPFFTTKEVGRGTGLGLAMVHGIVEQAGGHVHVESRLDHGARFVMHFPRLRESSAEGSAAGAPARSSGGTETVLLVEDEESVRRVAARVLRRAGYTVLEAAQGLDALRLLEEREGCIDLLLTDAVMPFMTGHELAERVRMQQPGIRILFTSGYTTDVRIHRAVDENELHFLPKPFSPPELLARVRAVLDG